jgi:FkbM family methyltransferase
MIHEALRSICRATFWPNGSIRRILVGPSAGLRYRLFPSYGLSPVFGRCEPHLQALMVKLLEPGDVAYDVGGNYGIHSLLMARLVGPTGTVCTFEPHPEIFKACSENIQLNDLRNVKVFELALGDKRGTVHFSPGDHDAVGHVIAEGSDEPQFVVQADTIDRLVEEGSIPPPSFAKVDVEGHESEVLHGAQATVARYRPVLAVDLHHPQADRKVGRFLIDHGYAAFRQQSLRRIKDLSHGWPLPDGIHGAVLGVPEEAVEKYKWLPKG